MTDDKVKRKKIVIASVLKPVSDPRMFEKFGLSLSKTDRYIVFLCGYAGSYLNIYPNIRFKILFSFYRLSLFRILAPFRFYYYLFKVHPQIIIVQTHELLWPAVWYKKHFNVKLIYDIQENYYLNIKFSSVFPIVFRDILAGYVRLKERWAARHFSHFILAEKSYAKELNFIRDNYTVIENKYKPIEGQQLKKYSNELSGKKRLTFTGTIAKETGILEAIQLARQLHNIDSEIYLVIAGYCADKTLQRKLKHIVKRRKYIKFIWGDKPLNHMEILKEIQKSSFGIVSYPHHVATANCIPTKLFEYIANELPVLCTQNPLWCDMVTRYDAGICFDFLSYDARDIYNKMFASIFYSKEDSKQELLWESEEERFINIIDRTGNF